MYVVLCTYNLNLSLVDCVFRNKEEAEKYAAAMMENKEEAAARCKELIALRDNKEQVKFLSENEKIFFTVFPADVK